MSNKDRLEVGMKVFLEPINNKARRGNTKPVPATIVKIGRKYFEVAQEGWENFPDKFRIEDLGQQTNYSPDWKFYFDEQHILDSQEHVKLTKFVRDKIGQYGQTTLSLEKLRKIYQIIVDKS